MIKIIKSLIATFFCRWLFRFFHLKCCHVDLHTYNCMNDVKLSIAFINSKCHLRNEFIHFVNVHGIMNTSGLLQSK